MDSLDDPSGESTRELKKTVWGIMEEVEKPKLADYFPLLRRIDPQGIRRPSEVHFGKMIDLFDRIIKQRLQLRKDTGNSIRDDDMLNTLIDISEQNIEEMNKTKMERLFVDLFAAGSETTSSTLEWAMVELLKKSEVLKKAQAELEQLIGKENQVKKSDITKLPYLQAIVKETFRLHPVIPLLLPRKSEADVKVCDYVIPKGAQVLINAYRQKLKYLGKPNLF